MSTTIQPLSSSSAVTAESSTTVSNVAMQRSTTKSRKKNLTRSSSPRSGLLQRSTSAGTNGSDANGSDSSHGGGEYGASGGGIEMSSSAHDTTSMPPRPAPTSVSSNALSVASSCDSDSLAIVGVGGLSEPLIPSQQSDTLPSQSSTTTSSPPKRLRRFRQGRLIRYQQQLRIYFDQVLISLDSPTLSFGRTLVILASAIYGTNFATIKVLDSELPLSISAALRFTLAATVVSMIVIGQEERQQAINNIAIVDPKIVKERTAAFYSGCEIGAWYCAGYLCQAEGLELVSAGKSAFFNSLAVILVPILDMVFKSKTLTLQTTMSILLSCFGVGLLELGPEGDLKFSWGDIYAMGQTFCFGIGYWRLEAVSHQHSHQSGRLTVGQLGGVAAGSTLFALLEMIFEEDGFPSIEQWVDWLGDYFILGALIWTGLVSTALALYLETVALKVISASELTLIMTSVSLWGAAFAYVTLGEVLSPIGMFGGVLIMIGCALGNLSPPSSSSSSIAPGTTATDDAGINAATSAISPTSAAAAAATSAAKSFIQMVTAKSSGNLAETDLEDPAISKQLT